MTLSGLALEPNKIVIELKMLTYGLKDGTKAPF